MAEEKAMSDQNSGWLPLLNYSTKHGISLSTLRRRIKSGTIDFKLDHGKYFILDEVGATAPMAAKPASKENAPAVESPALSSHSFVEASVLTSANRLVEEIKSAYAKILQEKEEQIAQLKEQVVDLKMLVKILEGGASAPQTTEPPAPAETRNEGSSNEDFFFSDYQSRDI